MHPLLAKMVEPASPLADKPKPCVQKMEYSHRAMAKVIAANPMISQNALAELFGYTPGWISRVKSTDAFQAILAEEMKDMPMTADMVVNNRIRLVALQGTALEILEGELAKPDVTAQLALNTLKVTSSALSDRGTVVVPPAEVHVHLEELGKNLVGLLRRGKQDAVDAEVVPNA